MSACSVCGAPLSGRLDTFDAIGDPVWGCMNDGCTNVEHQRFFDLRDVERTEKRD